MALRNLFAIALLNVVAKVALASQTLDYAYGEYQSAPYVYYSQKHKQFKGIMLDISQALSTRIPYDINYLNLPRKRTEQYLIDGLADIRCHLSPDWVEDADTLFWTQPLYSLNTVIITHTSFKTSIEDIEALKGLVLGTIHGYRYSREITEILEFLEARHIETPSLEHALQMLSKQRVQAVIGNHVLANYLMAQLDLQSTLKIHPYVVRTQPIHCALSRQSDIDTNTIINALHNMKKDGIFVQIFNRYFKPIDLAKQNNP